MNFLILSFLAVFTVLVVFFVVFIFLYAKTKETFETKKDGSIDIVYTWVYEDENLKTDIQKYDPTALFKGSFKNNDELKFSLRSLEKYAPWYNKIYVVVRDGQKPTWLRENGRLQFIEHSSIIPSQYLPTFNSLVIESFLHKIPNLSEKYIYFNDDLFLWNKVTPSIFFTADDKTLESGFSSSESIGTNLNYGVNYCFWEMVHYNMQILYQQFPQLNQKPLSIIKHVPTSQLVSVNYQLDEFLSSIPTHKNKNVSIDEYTKQSRFRQNENIARNSIFKKYFYLVHDYAVYDPNIRSELIKISNDGISDIEVETLYSSKRPFVCVQNEIDYFEDTDEYGFHQLRRILLEKFPHPSCHEILT
jgi:hypothetical protein